MDPEMEKRVAALILEEAKALRLRADMEGVHAYLEQPKVRGRPNAQFLSATVRSVQQANRMVEVNEMWRVRKKELELERKMHKQRRCPFCKSTSLCHCSERERRADKEESGYRDYKNEFPKSDGPESSDRRRALSNDSEAEYLDDLKDEGLQDEEVQDFLHSRAKRGRGAIGSRADETGPYLAHDEGGSISVLPSDMRLKEDWETRIIGPSMSGVDALELKVEKLKRKRTEDVEAWDQDDKKIKKKHHRSGSRSKSRKHERKKKSERRKRSDKKRKHRKD